MKWLREILSEDSNKLSFGRVFGAIVTVFILALAWLGKTIPDPVFQMFRVLVGYNLVSKSFNSDALMQWIQLRKPSEILPKDSAEKV